MTSRARHRQSDEGGVRVCVGMEGGPFVFLKVGVCGSVCAPVLGQRVSDEQDSLRVLFAAWGGRQV